MNRKLELGIILCAVVVLCSVASHGIVDWLRIKSTWGGYQCYGAENAKPLAILHGSSLAYSGVDWARISEELGGTIESWATAGSSPPGAILVWRRRIRKPDRHVEPRGHVPDFTLDPAGGRGRVSRAYFHAQGPDLGP